jgi:hypothetical protein
MGKLHIKTLEREPGGDYILRFVGHRPEFMAMVEDLKWERCRWEPDAGKDGRGGWLVDEHLLMEFAGADRFDNIWRLLHAEEDKRKQEERRRMRASIEKIERKLGIERSIDECPF